MMQFDNNVHQRTSFAFAIDLFHQIVSRSPQKNCLISPFSIQLALQMVLNGARGATAEALCQTLHIKPADLGEMNTHNAFLQKRLAFFSPKTRTYFANGLWLNSSIPIDSEFQKLLADFYRMDVYQLNKKSLEEINKWVKQKTQKKILKILDHLDPLATLVLINVIYFEGKWKVPFNLQSKSQPFYLADGQTKPYLFMSKSDTEWQYLETTEFQAIKFYYENTPLNMVLILPKPDLSLTDWLLTLNRSNWETWMSSFAEKKGLIELPPFKFDSQTNLKPVLGALGLTIPFDAKQADFSGISTHKTPIWIDKIHHRAYIEVDEKGTKAAAATFLVLERSVSLPVPRFEMIVNRPFFIAIQDDQTGTILFMGTVYDPTAS